jgi:alanine racemase
VWTHLSEASDAEDSRSIDLFTQAVATAQRAGIDGVVRHLAASAAAYLRTDARFDMVRVGAHLYGIGPGDGVGAADLGLEPVMTLSAPIIDVHRQGSRLYADIAVGGVSGLLSEAAGTVSVAIAGERYPLVAVELTHSVIDISADVNDSITPEDTVTLFGPGKAGEQTVNEWADAMGTIGEELVCRVSAHIPRVLTA